MIKKIKMKQMKAILFSGLIMLFFAKDISAQQFIDKAAIEYEVKSNIKKTMGNSSWEEMMKDNMPTFKTGYYTFTFADNKSLYKWDHWDEKAKLPEYMRRDDENNSWYFDHNAGKMNLRKSVVGSPFDIEDSIPALEWRITTESRVIAGFNCRKAVAKMFDSVYVFAFYTDEIMISGGPGSFQGLPGLILGVTIPRLYTSWIATKVSVNGIAANTIKPTTAKKYFTVISAKKTVMDLTKDWWTGDDATPEQRQQKDRFLWNALL